MPELCRNETIMTHTYQLTGMTCTGCEAKVTAQLQSVPGISGVQVSKEHSSAILTMDHHIDRETLQQALGGPESKYRISAQPEPEPEATAKSWLATYQPLLLVLAYILGAAIIGAYHHNQLHWMDFMSLFMGGFFLVFSFFKLLDVKGFADSYAMYDIIARRWKPWGYIYAFTELGLGIAYITHVNDAVTNSITLIVMTVSIIGVIQSVVSKKAIRCACLGSVFQLPMSTVTIIEDGLMIAMSAIMLLG